MCCAAGCAVRLLAPVSSVHAESVHRHQDPGLQMAACYAEVTECKASAGPLARAAHMCCILLRNATLQLVVDSNPTPESLPPRRC